MSREQYRARSKKVQKLGRDGLVEQDKATGKEKRISQRAADVSFGPRQSQDQAADRVSSQRPPTNAPAQGKRRKQPRPSPPQEPVQSVAHVVSDTSDLFKGPEVAAPEAITPVRQAGDVPIALPLRSDSASSPKHRQQKRANRLNQDAPSHFVAEDTTDSGWLRFESEYSPAVDTVSADDAISGPLPEKLEPVAPRGVDDVPMRGRPADRHVRSPTHRRAEGGGRLRFEPEPAPSADNANRESPPEESTPAPRGVKDTPVRERPVDRRVRSPTHRQAEGGGRLRFEPEPTPSADNANRESPPEESTPAAPRGVDDPMQGRRSAHPNPQPANNRRGRLQFEAERTPPPDITNTRTRRVAEANASATPQQPGDTPAPEYEGTSVLGHEDSSVPTSTDDPVAGLTRRQRKQYEKAERRVEQASQRLEKTQSKLPTRRRARLQKEYDANTGKVRRRLRFETEMKPEEVKPSIPAQVSRTVKTAAVMKMHSKIRENERDNTALEAAHKTEFAVEQGAGRFLRWNNQRLRSKPYRAVRRAEHQLRTDQTTLAWQTALRDNPDLRRKNALSKWVQKQKIKRRYAQAAREAKKTAQHTQDVLSTTGKIVRALQQFVSAHRSALLIVALLTLVVALFSAGLASCAAMLSGFQSSVLSATYLADEQEITNAELYFTELEANLQLDISNTEANYPGYDEYRYNIGDISHNPYELMSYLSATYGAFTFEQVRPELDRLFAEKYQLTRTPITETRYDENGQPYEVTVLQTTLTVGRLGDTIASSLATGDQSDLYSEYMRANGNRQAFGNPFDFPWLGYVSSGYGWRVHPTTGAKDLHRGVDIAVAQGTAFQSVQDGRVVSAGDMGGYGLCVVIEDDQGYQSRYAHCSTLNVSVGQEVKRGDVIGAVGSTGHSTGPHLHLEVMLNGEYLDPRYFVDTGDSGSSGALPGEPGGPVIPDNPSAAMGSDRFQAMLAEAEKYLGYPYVWGGTNPTSSFDCSGYVSWVINHSGWNYERLGVMGLEDVCTPVSKADAKPGDLVFFIGTYDAPYPNRPTHVGIYVGNGRFIHCGDPISYANLNSSYWVNHFYGFGRLPEP